MAGFLCHALMYLAKSVFVILRAVGITSFNALSLDGMVPSFQLKLLIYKIMKTAVTYLTCGH